MCLFLSVIVICYVSSFYLCLPTNPPLLRGDFGRFGSDEEDLPFLFIIIIFISFSLSYLTVPVDMDALCSCCFDCC
jgi:hypothetical protein